MARIKCRYKKHRCPYGDIDLSCWDKTESECPYFVSDSEEMGKYPCLLNPRCGHILTHDREFEKSCKSYEFEHGHDYGIWREGYLQIGRMFIDESDINYLEIDGRILIGGDQNA